MTWTIPHSALQVSKWLLSFCHEKCFHGNILIDLICNCEMTILCNSASQEPLSPFGDTYLAATLAIYKRQEFLKMWNWITKTGLSMNCYLKIIFFFNLNALRIFLHVNIFEMMIILRTEWIFFSVSLLFLFYICIFRSSTVH